MSNRAGLVAGWIVAVSVAVGVRVWNSLTGSLMWGYDAWGHGAYVLFLDLYRAVPWADQGWSYFHPPLHYLFGWALAQFGSGEVLVRGLSLFGGALSLGTAGLAAWAVSVASPGRPALALLGFCAVAFLPSQLFVGVMPGNEMTSCFLSAAALATFVANERRSQPTLWRDALTGLLLGLGLLVKFTGLVPLGVIGVALGLKPLLLSGPPALRRQVFSRTLVRGFVVAGVALALASPYYARNYRTYGGPFQKSSDFSLVREVERDQPPGQRSWRDYVNLSPRLFTDPNPLAPHLIHSVWGTLYLSVWAEIFRESDSSRRLEAQIQKRSSSTLIAILGLLPTALMAFGASLAARDVYRGRRREVYVTMLAALALGIVTMILYSWVVPRWPAIKAAYIFFLALPFAVFLARSIEALTARSPPWRVVLPGTLAAFALLSAAINTSGLVVPQRAHSPAMGAVWYYFGQYDEARRLYTRLIASSRYSVAWLDNLAAIELADGHTDRARRFYDRAVSLEQKAGRSNPYRNGQLAAAIALDGDLADASRRLDEVLAADRLPEPLANRGAIRAVQGDLGGAESDLRAALAAEPAQLPAWVNLAHVLEQAGKPEVAADVWKRAALQSCRPPRGYPYGVGTGESLEWGIGRRLLLLIEADELRAALPAFYRNACGSIGRSVSQPGA